MFGIGAVSALAAGYMLVSGGGCPQPQHDPAFDLQVQQQQTVVDQSLSAAQITQLKLQEDQGAVVSGDATAAASAARDAAVRQQMSMEGDAFYNGLTQGQVTGEMIYNITSVPVGNGEACLYADKVSLKLNYAPIIHIASEYASRPCADKVVRAHEALHVERDQQAIAEFAPRAKETMADFLNGLGGQGPYPQSQFNDAALQLRDTIQADLENGIMPALSMMRQQYQQGIDTPENYRYNASLCPAEDWLPQQ